MKFEVKPEVFELLPHYIVGVVCAEGVDNHGEHPEIAEFLAQSVAACEASHEGVKAKQAPEVQPYREAFRAVGINPNRYMCSIEALMDRICKKKGMPSVNPLVDLGNAVSLKHELPIGAHDWGTIEEALTVRKAGAEDTFVPFGGGDQDNPKEDEVVYVSGNQVRTRRWTWRQSEIGKITEETSDILFPVDGFSDFNAEQVKAACQELAADLEKYFGVKASVGLVDADHSVFEG